MSDSEEDMAVPEEAPVELVSAVTNDTLVVTVASSGEESDAGRTVELSSDSGIDEMVGGN